MLNHIYLYQYMLNRLRVINQSQSRKCEENDFECILCLLLFCLKKVIWINSMVPKRDSTSVYSPPTARPNPNPKSESKIFIRGAFGIFV